MMWTFQEPSNDTLVLQDVQKTAEDDYRIVVSNEFGQQTSLPATLTVVAAPPAIQRQHQDLATCRHLVRMGGPGGNCADHRVTK